MKNAELKQIILTILASGLQISVIGLFRLIYKTNSVQAPQLVVLNGYTSDKSDNTETQNCTINIGTKYANAKKTSLKNLSNLDAEDMQNITNLCTPDTIKGYSFIDLNGATNEAYCDAVKNEINKALFELLNPETKESNDIQINDILVFSPIISTPILDDKGLPTFYVKGENKGLQKFKVMGSNHLSILGELVAGGKRVIEEGETKLTKKAPKTVAKEVILNYVGARTSKIRRYAINNLESISIGGEKIAILEQ